MANLSYGKCYPWENTDQQAGETEWPHYGGSWGDGIVNGNGSAGASSFALTRSSSDRTMTLHLDDFRMRGYMFEPTQSTLALSLATIPAGQVRRDRLVAGLNFTNKQISFYLKAGTAVDASASPAFPGLTRTTGPGGIWEASLYTFLGGNVPASTLELADQRIFVGDRLQSNTRPGLNTELNLGRPDGTQVFIPSTGETWKQSYPGGVATWESIDNPDWTPVTLGALGKGTVEPAYRVVRGEVRFQGEVMAPVGTPWTGGPGKGAGQVPSDFAPATGRRFFPVALTGSNNLTVLVGRAYADPSGQLTLDVPDVPGVTIRGFDLATIRYPYAPPNA